uniref:Uncharacterized protein n=1 Tax=Branchiostoma floridae TaxID=7739 RepID=C3Z2Y4_BRAFL|eukprot:XP_002597373.1 hypothetical protein BRAFLDRAFT_66510 [Branchiostoma floridae]
MRWLGYVRHREDGLILKELLYGELNSGERSIGRSQLHFKDVCNRDLTALDIDTGRCACAKIAECKGALGVHPASLNEARGRHLPLCLRSELGRSSSFECSTLSLRETVRKNEGYVSVTPWQPGQTIHGKTQYKNGCDVFALFHGRCRELMDRSTQRYHRQCATLAATSGRPSINA